MKYSRYFREKSIALYAKGMTSCEVAERMHCDASSVQRWVKDCDDVNIRDAFGTTRTYEFNEDFFSQIDNEMKAYWIGFILGDGHITKDYNSLRIRLKKGDAGHLRKFKLTIESEYPVKITSNAGAVIQVNSHKMVADLVKLGIVPKKSLIAKSVNISWKLERHYFRGLVDADGSLGSRNDGIPFLQLAGTKSIVQDFSYFLGFHGCYIRPSTSIFVFKKQGRDVYRCLHKIYGDAQIYLDRKYNTYKYLIPGEKQLYLFGLGGIADE